MARKNQQIITHSLSNFPRPFSQILTVLENMAIKRRDEKAIKKFIATRKARHAHVCKLMNELRLSENYFDNELAAMLHQAMNNNQVCIGQLQMALPPSYQLP